jgi:4-carboxymuconolactone decarboxylase
MLRITPMSGDAAAISPDLMAQILERRGGKLRPSDGLLLHSDAVSEGWNVLFGGLANGVDFDRQTRELVIVRVAQLLGAKYELEAHWRAALAAGVPLDKLDALTTWRASNDTFTAQDRCVLAYAESMIHDVQVPLETFQAVKAFFTDRQIVELTMTVAAYSAACRFGEALGLEP